MKFAGHSWFYSYRFLHDLSSEEELTAVCDRMRQRYAKLTKAWTVDLNSEWTYRMYFATKMILNATALKNNSDFAAETGLRAAVPNFDYYAVLSLLRAIVMTIPEEPWDDGRLVEISHAKAIKKSMDWLSLISRDTSKEIESTIRMLKAQRELIAYRAPASGDANLNTRYSLRNTLCILAEAAQFNSELLEISVTKNADQSTFVVTEQGAHSIATVEIEGHVFSDDEDYHRLSYAITKNRRPLNLCLFMTKGQTEDFLLHGIMIRTTRICSRTVRPPNGNRYSTFPKQMMSLRSITSSIFTLYSSRTTCSFVL